MIPLGGLIQPARDALSIAWILSLPLAAAAAAIGLAVVVGQAAFSIQEPAMHHLVKITLLVSLLGLLAHWMGGEISSFAIRMFWMASLRG